MRKENAENVADIMEIKEGKELYVMMMAKCPMWCWCGRSRAPEGRLRNVENRR